MNSQAAPGGSQPIHAFEKSYKEDACLLLWDFFQFYQDCLFSFFFFFLQKSIYWKALQDPR